MSLNYQNRIKRIEWIMICSYLVLFNACEFIQIKGEKNKHDTRIPVARVYDTYLYWDDLEEGIQKKNNSERNKNYIKKWVKEQLFMTEALNQIDVKKANIEKKISNYRNNLIGYEFHKLYVQKYLNDSVTQSDITAYYNTHQDKFILKQNIIRGIYIKAPKGVFFTKQLKYLMHATDKKNRKKLKSYCLQFSTIYHLDDSQWVVFGKLILQSPLSKIKDKVLFLNRYSYYKTQDNNFFYFLKINAYKIAGDISPMKFVEEDIKNIILNKRKVALIEKLKNSIYKKAIENEDFEFYLR